MDRDESREIAVKIIQDLPKNWIDSIGVELEKAYLKGRLDGQESLAASIKKDREE